MVELKPSEQTPPSKTELDVRLTHTALVVLPDLLSELGGWAGSASPSLTKCPTGESVAEHKEREDEYHRINPPR